MRLFPALRSEPATGPLDLDLSLMKRRHLAQVMDIEYRVYPRPWSEALFVSELAQPSSRFYVVARSRHRVVGYAGSMVFSEEAHITTVAVDPRVHRRKVGARLLYALISGARARGAAAAQLEVRVANTGAQDLYRKFGFAPVGIRKNYYSETGEDALVMWAEGLQTEEYEQRLADVASWVPEPREVR